MKAVHLLHRNRYQNRFAGQTGFGSRSTERNLQLRRGSQLSVKFGGRLFTGNNFFLDDAIRMQPQLGAIHSFYMFQLQEGILCRK
jgi:hypothetical protein